jgi:predicted amidohydrolase
MDPVKRLSNSLRITMVQSNLHWEDRDKNFEMFDKLLNGLKGKTDIVVLPEMFTSGFSMNTKKLAEHNSHSGKPGKTLAWMQQKAAEMDVAIIGSIIAEEGNKYFNRLLWVNPDGSWEKYDKRHLFTMVGEDDYFTAGKERLIVNYKGWKILPLVCYDLRFPVWARNKKQADGQPEFDLMIYVANWPEARKQPWKKLLLARAIENQAFVVGVNRVGADEKGIVYSGDSSLIDPYGEYIAECEVGEEQVLTATFDYQILSDFRKKFPVLDDGDGFVLL